MYPVQRGFRYIVETDELVRWNAEDGAMEQCGVAAVCPIKRSSPPRGVCRDRQRAIFGFSQARE